MGLIEDHEGIGQGAAPHVGQGSHLDHPFLQQARGAFGPQEGVEGVVEGAQVGIHLLLQITRQKAQPLARFHRRPGQHQPFHLAFGEHAHRQHGG